MKRNHVLAALALSLGLTSTGQTVGLNFEAMHPEVSRTEKFNVAGLPQFAVGTKLSLGTLTNLVPGTAFFTFLGQESGYVNTFNFYVEGAGSPLLLKETDSIDKTISAVINTVGAVNFRFTENTGVNNFAQNGGTWATGASIGLIGNNMKVRGNDYEYVLGYNDTAGKNMRLGDWDDFVVGVNFTPRVDDSQAPIPEPETYAMMLAGLGVMGAIARRRKATK